MDTEFAGILQAGRLINLCQAFDAFVLGVQ